jgi:hypothetical protein
MNFGRPLLRSGCAALSRSETYERLRSGTCESLESLGNCYRCTNFRSIMSPDLASPKQAIYGWVLWVCVS